MLNPSAVIDQPAVFSQFYSPESHRQCIHVQLNEKKKRKSQKSQHSTVTMAHSIPFRLLLHANSVSCVSLA